MCVPHYGKPVNIAHSLEVARGAEDMGFDSIWVTDHLLVPRTLDIIYRDNMLEPIALLSHLAAVTQRVRVGTSVIILPYRHPITVAKMLATIDQLSGGRLIFGAAVGWMEEEFQALGQPFAERGVMSDEHLRLIRALWTSEVVSFAGKYTHFTDMQASPRPVQQPHPPIWIGGNSRRAQRRVVELGDGWHATGAAPADIAAGRTYIQQLWSQQGRAGQPLLSLRIGLFIDGISEPAVSYPSRGRLTIRGSVQQIVDTLGAYKEAGIEHVVCEMSTQVHDSILRAMETVMHRMKPQVA
jgi:probable F420-dependent oxidoreductase